MTENELKLVRIREKDLETIQLYTKIFKWTPSKLFEELASGIRKTVPDLFVKTAEELRDEGLTFHVKVFLLGEKKNE